MSGSIRREVTVPVTPGELWPALTEPSQLAEWFAPDVAIDLRPGGEAVFRWDQASRRAVVEEVDEPHRFAFRWAQPDEGDGAIEFSRVEFTLEPVEQGTRLRVVETAESVAGLPAVAACLGASAGWETLLLRLAGRRFLVEA